MVGNGEEILGGSGLDATDIRKLKEELENQQKENERMRTELTKKDNRMKELQWSRWRLKCKLNNCSGGRKS